MRYYSDVLKKPFDTEEQLNQAEKEHRELIESRKEEEKKVSKKKKELSDQIREVEKSIREAREKKKEAKEACEKRYQQYVEQLSELYKDYRQDVKDTMDAVNEEIHNLEKNRLELISQFNKTFSQPYTKVIAQEAAAEELRNNVLDPFSWFFDLIDRI